MVQPPTSRRALRASPLIRPAPRSPRFWFSRSSSELRPGRANPKLRGAAEQRFGIPGLPEALQREAAVVDVLRILRISAARLPRMRVPPRRAVPHHRAPSPARSSMTPSPDRERDRLAQQPRRAHLGVRVSRYSSPRRTFARASFGASATTFSCARAAPARSPPRRRMSDSLPCSRGSRGTAALTAVCGREGTRQIAHRDVTVDDRDVCWDRRPAVSARTARYSAAASFQRFSPVRARPR